MKKSSRYIAICITALFLSISIPFVSFADDVLTVEYSLYENTNTTDVTLSTTKPSFQHSDFFHLDLVPSDTTDIEKYLYYRTNYLSSTGTASVSIRQNFSVSDYNYFSTVFVLPANDTNGVLTVRLTDSPTLSNYVKGFVVNQSGHYVDDYLDLTYNYTPAILTDNNNHTYTVMVFSVIGMVLGKGDYTKGAFWTYNKFRLSPDNYTEVIVPYYKIFGRNSSSPETSDDTSDDISGGGGGSSSDLSEIQDKLDDITDNILDSISATNEVKNEVSQLHNDLTSLPSDFDESSYQGVVDNVSSSVSDITSYEGIINDAIESNASDVANFDVSGLESYVEEGLNPLTNDTEDLAFESFLKNMYDSLGMATYFIVFAPFAIIFVLFKFVIGGIT